MNIKVKAAGISLAAIMLAGSTGAALAQAGTTVCYAFQDLSTGFWVAGHGAIVETLQKSGRRSDRTQWRARRQPPTRTGQGLHRAGWRRCDPDRR